jgi:hypothetical protein
LARRLRVTIQKFDPYINIDPGTLNPYEHGECYVTDDVFADCPSLKRVIIRSKELENEYWIPEGCEVVREA